MEVSPELLPDSYDELIPVSNLILDPYNVREEEPTNDLVESVRASGFREATIIRPSHDGKYLVTDGWQRVQAGVKAGWTKIPCKIYETPLQAMQEAQRASIKREWTTFQRISHYRNYYDACREAGLNHDDAVIKTASDNPGNEDRVLRNLRITRLPSIVQALVKKSVERTQQEWSNLEKVYSAIKMKRKSLPLGVASAISLYLRTFSPERQAEAAIGVLEFKNDEAVKIIRLISIYPQVSPFEVIQEYKMGYGPDEIIDVGAFNISPAAKQQLKEYCSSRRINIKDFVRELLNDWCIVEQQNTHSSNLTRIDDIGIREVSFQIGNRRATIYQRHGLNILIDGSPPFFFNNREILSRSWNSNVKIPQYVKDFLNGLNIEFSN